MKLILLAADVADFSKLLIPCLILMGFLALMFIMWAIVKRYKRIAPNEIGVIYGKRHKTKVAGPDGQETEVGFRLVTGGGVFIMPIFEAYEQMSTEAFQIQIEEKNIPTKKNVAVTIMCVATCRVSQIPAEQVNAVTNFLGKAEDERNGMIREILRGHLRSIVGGLEIEELLRERSKFNDAVLKECSAEISRMGIKILTLLVQDVRDQEGFIEALGKQSIAITKRDANIAVAEADRDTAIRTSNAKREAAEAENQNNAKIAEAQKEFQMRQADFKKQTAAVQAEADMSGEIAKTAQEQKLVVLQAERDAAGVQAQTKVQTMQIELKKNELQATTIVTAEATARANVITAEGKRNAAVIDAEAAQKVATLTAETARMTAEGNKNAAILEGEGESSKLKAIALATADGERAKLVAVADGQKAGLLATAEGLRASKLAEAEGTQKLAEALTKLNQTGQLVMILDRLPILLKEGGDAGAKIAAEIFGPMGEGIGAIKDIRIIDMGGGNSAQKGIGAISGMIPDAVASFFAKAKLQGVDLTPLFKFLKMDPAALSELISPLAEKLPEKPASTPAAPAEDREGTE